MNVKEWQPADGCPNCARAKQMFHEHTSMAMATHAQYMSKIRELTRQLDEARDALKKSGGTR